MTPDNISNWNTVGIALAIGLVLGQWLGFAMGWYCGRAIGECDERSKAIQRADEARAERETPDA